MGVLSSQVGIVMRIVMSGARRLLRSVELTQQHAYRPLLDGKFGSKGTKIVGRHLEVPSTNRQPGRSLSVGVWLQDLW